MQAVVSILPFLGCGATGALITLLVFRRLRAVGPSAMPDPERKHEPSPVPIPPLRTAPRRPQLERIAEMSGIPEHCALTQRDMIVQLPGHRTIVVDAKTPTMRLLEAIAAGDESRRRCARAELVRIVRHRAEALRRASYWNQFNRAPDFVVLFLPSEALFNIVMREDPGILETCSAHNVLVVTPTTLIALLKSVAHAWREAARATNGQDLARVSRDLYDRVKSLADGSVVAAPALAARSSRIF